MSNPEVHDLMRQLHHELKQAETLSERDRQLFNHLAAQVQELIEKPENPPELLSTKIETAIAEMEAAIAEMETTHPSLTLLMGRLVSGLSNMGI